MAKTLLTILFALTLLTTLPTSVLAQTEDTAAIDAGSVVTLIVSDSAAHAISASDLHTSAPTLLTSDLTFASGILTSPSLTAFTVQPALVSAGTLLDSPVLVVNATPFLTASTAPTITHLSAPIVSTPTDSSSGGTHTLWAPTLSSGSTSLSHSNNSYTSSGSLFISSGSFYSFGHIGHISPIQPLSPSISPSDIIWASTLSPQAETNSVIPEPTALLFFTILAPQFLLRRFNRA